MKALVVYDSLYGNTEKVAQSIAAGMGTDVKPLRASQVDISQLKGLEVLVIGSPTQGGGPMPSLAQHIAKIPPGDLEGATVAVFDTRLTSKWARIFGFAAPRMARALESKRPAHLLPPQGFFVQGTKGPLADGELERAAAWAKNLVKRD